MSTKSFHELIPGDVVTAYGGTMRVISRRDGRPGNIPSGPTRTIVEWQEIVPPGEDPATYRGPWEAGRTTGDDWQLQIVGTRRFLGIRGTWMTNGFQRFTVRRYQLVIEDSGPEYATDDVAEVATWDEAMDILEYHPRYVACATWDDVVNAVPSAPGYVRTYKSPTTGRWVVKFSR